MDFKLPPLEDLEPVETNETAKDIIEEDIDIFDDGVFSIEDEETEDEFQIIKSSNLPNLEKDSDSNQKGLPSLLVDIEGLENYNEEDFIEEDYFEDEIAEDNLLPNIEEKKDPLVKVKVNVKGMQFKEINEEAITEFMNSLKNKILAIIKPKENKSPKGMKDKKNDKISKLKENKKNIINIFKMTSILLSIVIIIFIIVNFLFLKPGKPLEELSHVEKITNGKVVINNIERYGEGLQLTFDNQVSKSTEFFVDIKLKADQGLFKKEEFICRSDIIFLEVNEKITEEIKCEGFIETDKYFIEVYLNEIK